MAVDDDWPMMPDGSDFDGKGLLSLVRGGNSPFKEIWDVNLLIQEIEDNLEAHVIDIPFVYNGSNNYGFHFKLSNQKDVLARLARGDVNMPDFDGFPIEAQVPEVQFEVATYELLRSEPQILASSLIYHRIPVQRDGPRREPPRDIKGRRLLLFERAEGENNVWRKINPENKSYLLAQAANIRAALFKFNLPLDFAVTWLRERLFEQKPRSFPLAVAPTRDFCVALLTSKIEATIRDIGDMIGWEDDNNTVGPIAAAAKQSLLRLIPHILPDDTNQPSLYRLILDHGDFGIHNMSIKLNHRGQPVITSLYDWETGCIVPAILSDPLMAVSVDLVMDENTALPSITRVPKDTTVCEFAEYMTWANDYFKVLFNQAPTYEHAIQAGKNARHLWFALRDWRGDDPEGYFGNLGGWAETKMKELDMEFDS